MGEIHKIGEEYYIEFLARGLKYQQKVGGNRDAAEKALKEIEAKIARGEAAIIVRDVDLDIFLKDFSQYILTQHTPKTVERYQALINYFGTYLKKHHPQLHKLSEITPGILEQYKIYLLKNSPDERKIKPRLINFTFILLADTLEYARKLSYLNDNPSIHITPVKEPVVKKPRTLSEEEAVTLLRSVPPDWRNVIEFILGTGLRPNVLVNLKWRDVDLEKKVLKVPAPNKFSQTYEIQIHPRIEKILNDVQAKALANFIFNDPAGRPWTAANFNKELDAVLSQNPSGKKVNGQILRQSFGAMLVSRKMPLSQVYKILGESDIARAMIYFSFIPRLI